MSIVNFKKPAATTDPTELLQAFRQLIAEEIPLSQAMGLEILEYTDTHLLARAPLAPNINDKGTAFGGSQAALMTLVAWGVIWLETRQAGLDCDIVIHKGEILFSQPLQGEIRIRCELPSEADRLLFLQTYARRGKAAISLKVQTLDGNNLSTEFNCRYVAIKKDQ